MTIGIGTAPVSLGIMEVATSLTYRLGEASNAPPLGKTRKSEGTPKALPIRNCICFRVGPLVVNTGFHYKHWTRKQGRRLLPRTLSDRRTRCPGRNRPLQRGGRTSTRLQNRTARNLQTPPVLQRTTRRQIDIKAFHDDVQQGWRPRSIRKIDLHRRDDYDLWLNPGMTNVDAP